MKDYISTSLSTLNEDLNAAVEGVGTLTTDLTTLSSTVGDINTILDSINGEVV